MCELTTTLAPLLCKIQPRHFQSLCDDFSSVGDFVRQLRLRHSNDADTNNHPRCLSHSQYDKYDSMARARLLPAVRFARNKSSIFRNSPHERLRGIDNALTL